MISLLSVSKKLSSANVKFLKIHKYSRNTWIATFPSKAAANGVLNNKYVKEAGFTVYIPGYKLSRKFILKGIPTDCSLDKIKTAIEEENNNIMIVKIFRMKCKDRNTGEWIDSETICVQILGENLPKEVIILRTVNQTSPYISAVRLCFKCGFYSHLSKYCGREEKCLQCAGTHQSSKEGPCQFPKKCINCGDAHATTDRSCSIYKRHAEIAKIMAFDNLSYFEAKALTIQQEKKNIPPPPDKTLKSFPQLPKKKGITLINTPLALQEKYRNDRSWVSLFRDCGEEIKAKIFSLIDYMLDAEDIDLLLSRVENTIRKHEEILNVQKIN